MWRISMNADDFTRMWSLYEMAAQCSVDGAHPTIRGAALDGIEAEITKQGCAMEWLGDVLHPGDILITEVGGVSIVVVRDRHTRGFRGSSGADRNEAASSTIARHLPYCGLLAPNAPTIPLALASLPT